MWLYILNSEGESLGRGSSVHAWPPFGDESAMIVAGVDVCLSISVSSLPARVEVKCLGNGVDSGANPRWKSRCSGPKARKLFIRGLIDFAEDEMLFTKTQYTHNWYKSWKYLAVSATHVLPIFHDKARARNREVSFRGSELCSDNFDGKGKGQEMTKLTNKVGLTLRDTSTYVDDWLVVVTMF
jgi:hypothetical protein